MDQVDKDSLMRLSDSEVLEVDDESVEDMLAEANTEGTSVPINPDHIQCKTCKNIYPTAYYKKKLSKARSAALLKRPTRTNLIVIAKDCKYCRTDKKRTTPLTRKEIQNKVASGDMHSILGELKIKEMDESANAKKAAGVKRRWNKHRLGREMEIYNILHPQVRRKQRYYSTNKTRNKYPELIAYAELDYRTALEVRDRVCSEGGSVGKAGKENIVVNKYSLIEDFLTTAQRVELNKLWESVPLDVKIRQKRRSPLDLSMMQARAEWLKQRGEVNE